MELAQWQAEFTKRSLPGTFCAKTESVTTYNDSVFFGELLWAKALNPCRMFKRTDSAKKVEYKRKHVSLYFHYYYDSH